MAKKKISEKIRLFYRGPINKPARVATEGENQIISTALTKCVPKCTKAFVTECWANQVATLRLVVGLSQSLRCLKHGRTKAMIYDDMANLHLIKYLEMYARKSNIPIIKAHGLMDVAKTVGLQTMLVVSIVDLIHSDNSLYTDHPGNAKPKPNDALVKSRDFDRLCEMITSNLQQAVTDDKISPATTQFKMPHLEKVKCSGKSKAKKEARKESKKRTVPASEEAAPVLV